MNAIDLIKKDLQNKKDLYGRPMIDTIVVLKKDDKGYYIEYAFKEGAPHDNRCLCWYNSYQPNAYKRNGWFKTADDVDLSDEETSARLAQLRSERDNKVGMIFELGSFTCGFEENEEEALKDAKKAWDEFHPDEEFVPKDHICKVGCPAKGCTWHKYRVLPWTYEEPVKCACWYAERGKTMEEFINDYKITMPATELAKLM